ncbi:MAG: phage terminase large subunit [Ruminococcus sp.]|nr:phage terminase large subunit [Ruminococcus sp.]
MSEVRLSSVLGPSYYGVARDVLDHKHTHYDFGGGRGSLKSSAISLLVPLLIVQHPDVHALVLRKVGNTIRDSVYAQYIWGIAALGMASYWDAKISPMELTYKPTGQKIMFRGADDPMKIKSIKVPFGYIGITHFEEKDQFAGRAEIRTILQSTMRGGEMFWNFESYNPPISRDNWANIDSQEERPDRLCHKSTYLEAPPSWLGEQFLAEAEYLKETNEKAYQHEYLGIPVGTGSDVFENVTIREITDEEIAGFDRVYNGVDWGYFPDPWAFNRVCFNAAQRQLFIFDELTANKLGNKETADKLLEHGLTKEDRITADGAEPKSVADYNKYGLKCFGAIKGPGSVERSMVWLQSLNEIVIDKRRCPDTAREFLGYEYERTRDGEIMSGYPDMNNHHIDAVRYATEEIWRRPGNAGPKSDYVPIWGR